MATATPAGSLVLWPLTLGALAGGVVAPMDAGSLAVVTFALGALAAVAAAAPRAVRVMVLALAVGGTMTAAHAALRARPLPDDHIAMHASALPTAVEGVVVASSGAGAGMRLTLAAEEVRSAAYRGPVHGALGITVAHPTRAWPVGVRLRVVGRMRRPRNFGNPGGYDIERALARRDVFVTMFLWNDTALTVLAPAAGLAAAIDQVRGRIGDAIDGGVQGPARAFLRAVLLGEDGALPADLRRMLARTGLSHVVSVSGFHLAVVGAAAILALRWLLAWSERLLLSWNVVKVAAVAGVVPVVAYATLAGGSVPAWRSLLMYGALVAALFADRPSDGLRSLAAAALLLALVMPDIAADISSELSFVSVAALILTAVPTARRRRDAVSWRTRAVSTVAVPLRVAAAAAIATAPLTAWHFQQVSLIAPLANLVALPFLGPGTLLPGLAALPLVPFTPALAQTLLAVAAAAAAAGLWLAGVFAAIPGAALATPMPNLFEVALCYAAFALALLWRRVTTCPRRLAMLALLVLAGGDCAYWIWERCFDPRLRVTFLSVGQGDAAVVELPRGGVVVIDGGGLPGDFDTGERLIAPFLRSRKILHLDVLALSHPQLDHYGGLAYLAEHFAPGAFWSSGARAAAPGFVRLERALAAVGTRHVVLRRGMRALARADVAIDVLHPAAPPRDDPNNGSLVLRLTHGAARVLFTGDVEGAAETELVGDGAPPPTPVHAVIAGRAAAATVLKVPHHGSATSSSERLLAAVAPRVAVISAGADNRFRFPAAAVLQRLREHGAEIWRTDQDGAVQLESDGTRLTVSTPRALRPPRTFVLAHHEDPAASP